MRSKVTLDGGYRENYGLSPHIAPFPPSKENQGTDICTRHLTCALASITVNSMPFTKRLDTRTHTYRQYTLDSQVLC